LMPDSLRRLHNQAFARHVRTGQRHMSWDRVELTAQHHGGKAFPIELSLAESKVGGRKFFTGIIRDVTERKNAEAELHKLSAQLLRLQDEERRKIARELHDSVGQLLAAISMNIGVVQSQSRNLDSRGARAVAENAQLVRQVSDEIRTLSHLLHPPLLEIAGLDSALRWYVDGFSERSKIRVDLEIPPDFQRLEQEKELAIFRIVQECLTIFIDTPEVTERQSPYASRTVASSLKFKTMAGASLRINEQRLQSPEVEWVSQACGNA